jgi:hypothetical protein
LDVILTFPELWGKTQSDADAFLFRAHDFADPSRSIIFNELFNRPAFSEKAKTLASISSSSFNDVPSLVDFLAGRNIPQYKISVSLSEPSKPLRYSAQYPVLDANEYEQGLRHVGDRVELIGQIQEVKRDKTKYNKPYVFVNFGPWRGNILKLNIWSEGLAVLEDPPNDNWVGKWISVVGLLEPPYHNKKLKYSHISVTITQANQIHQISEQEAKFRIGNSIHTFPSTTKKSTRSNMTILQNMQRGSSDTTTKTQSNTHRKARTGPSTYPLSGNEKILAEMKKQQKLPPSSMPTTVQSQKVATVNPGSSANKGCWIWIVLGLLFLMYVFANLKK